MEMDFQIESHASVRVQIYSAFYKWKCKMKGTAISFCFVTMLSSCRPVSIAKTVVGLCRVITDDFNAFHHSLS